MLYFIINNDPVVGAARDRAALASSLEHETLDEKKTRVPGSQ